MTDLVSLYSSKVEAYTNALQKLKRQLFYIAIARIGSFLLFIFFIYLAIKGGGSGPGLFAIIMFAVFLLLVKKSNDLGNEKRLFENRKFVNENELAILQGGKNKFDNGSKLLSNESYYADLDIFGEASLFHLLNRCSTSSGYNALADILKHPSTDAVAIIEKQHAVQALSSQHELREMVIAKALLYKDADNNIEDVKNWLLQPVRLLGNNWINIVRFLLPLLNVVALIYSLATGTYAYLSLTILISWLHVGYYTAYINRQYMLLGRKQEILNQYAHVLMTFLNVKTNAASLLQQMADEATVAHTEISRLAKLSNLLDQRLNLLVNILLNSFLLYDVQCMAALESWKVKNKDKVSSWISCVASIEVFTSLSAFAFNRSAYCYPVLGGDKLIIEAEEVGHPLIDEAESVRNDISLGTDNKLLLITGSNMSGKTTFLRTVGINILLAQCGAPVCAKSFKFSPVDIYTSIRISDSLQEHTSYFMAELKRLSEIKEQLIPNKPSLVLIDEILRGTNSEDKYFGSAEFIKQLVQYNCLTLFATHDLKLSEMEQQYKGVIENYCFESMIEGDDLKFNYKILNGVAKNKNASFLMKKMKII